MSGSQRPSSSRSFFAQLSLRLAVLLLVLLGWLTVPKIAPRMRQFFVRRDVKVQLAQRALGRDETPPEVRASDIAWIATVVTGGLLLLGPLGYFALRPRKPGDAGS
jgi:hypothetical protein